MPATPQAQSREPVSIACELCPLNRVKSGLAVRIRTLLATPDVAQRLREVGFCEDRIIRLINSSANVICLVCSARFALSHELAAMILVEPAVDV